jgi:1-acyl-sn-glycerol-3-phosphate acyltransferase
MTHTRYKSLSISYFSVWRAWVQKLTIMLLVMPLFRLAGKRLRVVGKSHVPRHGKFILAAHHISLDDPPLIATAIQRPVAYMAKKELFSHWAWAEFYRFMGTFALDRDQPDVATLKTAFNVCRSPGGLWVLGLFPEGTRSINGDVMPLKKGIGALAQKTRLPILPVGCATDSRN